MAKLPRGIKRLSSADVSAARVPSDPGVRVPQTGIAEAEAVFAFGNKIQADGERLLQKQSVAQGQAQKQAQNRLQRQFAAQARRQDRQDQIQGVKAYRSFNENATKKFTEIMDTEDISLQETQDSFRSLVEQEKTTALENYKGSGVGREKLEFKLETLTSKFLDESSLAGEKEQRRVLGQQITEDIDSQVAAAQADPTMLAESLANIDQILKDNENTLTPEQEEAFRATGRSQVYTQSFNTQIFKGDIDNVIDLINSPEAQRSLGPEKIQAMRLRVKKYEDSRDEDPGLADKVQEYKDLGIVLSKDEIKELGGLKNTPEKLNNVQEFLTGVKSMEAAGIKFTQEQLNQGAAASLGIEPTGTQVGKKEAEEIIAKNAKLKMAGELPRMASDLTDESGNVKNEVTNTIAARTAELFGGTFNQETGKSDLNPEQAQVALQINTDAEKLIQEGAVRGVSEAVAIASIGVELPKPVSALQVADDIIKRVETPTKKSISRDAATFDKVDLNNATGAASAFVEFWGRTVGQASNDFVDVKNVEDRNKLKMLAHEFIIANKRSDRLPVFEQKRLEAIFSGPSVLESGESMRGVFRSLDDRLTHDLEVSRGILSIGKFDGKEQQNLVKDIVTMTRFQKKLRAFDMSPGGSDTIELNSIEDVNSASDRDITRFARAQTEASFSTMAPEVKKAMKARLRGETTEKPADSQAKTQRELTPESKAIILDATDEDLGAMIEEARKTDSEFLPFLEEEFKTRAGQGSETRKEAENMGKKKSNKR